MTTKKKLIFDALKSVVPNTHYADSLNTQLPRARFSLIHHDSVRYSNKRHGQRLIYQVDYFSNRALEVESDTTLWGIINALEDSNLLTSDWREAPDVDEKANRTVWHYWLEVR